jgi:O-antigen ligase/polysaccharide polymerase Wzy-like membrane protein
MPSMVLVSGGYVNAGGLIFYAFLLMFLAYYILSRQLFSFWALTLSAIPTMSYLRDALFYNSLIAILGIGLVYGLLKAPQKMIQLWNNLPWRLLLFGGGIFWGLSVLLTRQYSSNLQIFELVFSAATICLLAGDRRYLATALVGVGISICTIGLALLGHGERLGMASINDVDLGNPIIFGLSTALIFLLALVDNGKWLFLHNSPTWRQLVAGTALILLLLSTSRGSWVVAVAGLMVILIWSNFKGKKQIIVSFFIMGIFFIGLLQTEKGERVIEWYGHTMGEDVSASNSTSGRSEMWELFPKVFLDSPIWGFGPGSGPAVYATYSISDPRVTFKRGVAMQWHALYLHIGVETGLIGLTMVTVFFVTLIYKVFIYRRVHGEVGPLLGIVCFMTIGLSVTALDPLSGMFLGLALLGTTRGANVNRQKRLSVRFQVAKPGIPEDASSHKVVKF